MRRASLLRKIARKAGSISSRLQRQPGRGAGPAARRHPLLRWQQLMGNREVQRFFPPAKSQTRSAPGEPQTSHNLDPTRSEPIIGELTALERGGLIGGIAGAAGGLAAGLALAGPLGPGLAILAGLGIAAVGTLAGLGLGALFGGSATARRNAGIVRVTPTLPGAVYDHSLSGAEIAARSSRPSPADRAGLTKASLFGRLVITEKGDPARKREGKFAYWIESMEFQFGFHDIIVYLAKEYPGGSCEYQATRDHENEHVEVDRRLVTEYTARIRDAILESMPLPTEEDPLWVASKAEGDAAIERIKTTVATAAIGPLYNQLRAELHAQNRALDTPEHYRKVYDKCLNW